MTISLDKLRYSIKDETKLNSSENEDVYDIATKWLVVTALIGFVEPTA